MNRRRLNRWRIGVGVAAVIAAVGGTCAWMSVSGGRSGAGPGAAPAAGVTATLSAQSMDTVATVGGTAIPVREFELFLARDRAAAFAYFQQHYGASDGPAFWTTAHGGQTPTAYLERQALTDAVSTTVQRQLAQRYSLLSDPGYPAFLQALSTENARREAALSRHQPIYGPVQYTEANYFTYQLDNLVPQIQTALIDKGLVTTAATLPRQYYSTHPDQLQQQYDAYVTGLAKAATVHVDDAVLAQVPVS
jgi:hypothetical protein